MGDCVVGHCHLYPLHSWRDILLTFAEMGLDSTTMFPPVTDDDSDLNSDTEVVWVKSARGGWGMGHSFGNKLYFTRDILEGKWVPQNLLAPAKPPTKKAKPPPKSAAQSIPVESGEHVQEFKVSGAGPRNFRPSRSRSRSPYIGSPLNVSYAEFFRFMLQFLCLQMCVYSGSAVPRGGGGVHLVTVPQGVVGDRPTCRSLGWGTTRGGGGTCVDRQAVCSGC